MPADYEPRFYREWPATPGLTSFDVRVGETDLRVRAEKDLSHLAEDSARQCRADIQNYAARCPEFLSSLEPLAVPPRCPKIVRKMLLAGRAYGVGPMAAVAGAVAEAIGRGLLIRSRQCIIENGGDLFLRLDRPAKLGLYAGPASPFTQRLKLVVGASSEGVGVCASSGAFGHSYSMGKADVVVALASDAALADAAATAVCNRIQSPDDVAPAVEEERQRGLLLGLVVAMGKRIGAFGGVELEA